jgi:hypothetical protein
MVDSQAMVSGRGMLIQGFSCGGNGATLLFRIPFPHPDLDTIADEFLELPEVRLRAVVTAVVVVL